MELVVIILNKTECLESLLKRFRESDIHGATIVDSKGMAHSLCDDYDDTRMFGTLRRLLDPEHRESKTIFTVIDPAQIPVIARLLDEVTGGLDHPDTGVMFTLPVNYTKGFGE